MRVVRKLGHGMPIMKLPGWRRAATGEAHVEIEAAQVRRHGLRPLAAAAGAAAAVTGGAPAARRPRLLLATGGQIPLSLQGCRIRAASAVAASSSRGGRGCAAPVLAHHGAA